MNKPEPGANLDKLPCMKHFCNVHKSFTVISPVIGNCTGCGRSWAEEIKYQRESGVDHGYSA